MAPPPRGLSKTIRLSQGRSLWRFFQTHCSAPTLKPPGPGPCLHFPSSRAGGGGQCIFYILSHQHVILFFIGCVSGYRVTVYGPIPPMRHGMYHTQDPAARHVPIGAMIFLYYRHTRPAEILHNPFQWGHRPGGRGTLHFRYCQSIHELLMIYGRSRGQCLARASGAYRCIAPAYLSVSHPQVVFALRSL